MPFYYTYVLVSLRDGKRYIGYTENIRHRMQEHNNGQADATRQHRPFQLIYFEACRDKAKAIAREKYFKTGFGRRFLNSRI